MKKVTKAKKQSESPYQQYVKPGLNLHDIHEIKKIFDTFDLSQSGYVAPSQLKKALREVGFTAESHPLYQHLCDLESDGQGQVPFEQFVTLLTSNVTGHETEAQMRQIFSLFDDQKTGFVNINGLRRLTRFYNLHLDEEDLEEMIKQADSDGDGFVTFEDFQAILQLTTGA